MPEISSFPPGKPCWFDLMCPEPAKDAGFYEQLFGWRYALPPGEPSQASGYGIFFKGDKEIAGVGPLPPGAPPSWNMYVCVADAAATAQRVKNAGGSVIEGPFQVGDMGHTAPCTDSAGVPFMIWQPIDFAGAALALEPGAVCWVELNTRDKSAAAKFYGDAFGWTAKDGPGGYTMFENDGAPVAGLLDMDAVGVPAEAPSYWAIYLGVEDVDATTEQCKQLGGGVIVEPMDVPGMRMAVLNDPTGAVFTITTP